MNTEQQAALDMALSGHSFLLTGKAGTGKTYTLGKIVEGMVHRDPPTPELLICGATGLSSVVLKGKLTETVTTLHSAFGLMDGRFSADRLVELFMGEDEYYIERRERLRKADVLIIDEISMISSHTLNVIHTLLQVVKKNKLVMGGIQRIFCGDFLQLPPIANSRSDDVGEPCVLSPEFGKYMPHKIILEQIRRTSDAVLSRSISEISEGICSDETLHFIEACNQPLKVPDDQKLVLYSQRINVDMHNAECLGRLHGQLQIYESQDTGTSQDFQHMLAEKRLMLKVGAPVMLIKNLSDTLVNGLRGKVAKLKQEEVIVHFPSLSRSHTFKAEKFTRYDHIHKKEISRKQIPLLLCYATTVHKSQGLSADYVEVHAEDMLYPALLAVAVSRVTSRSGLYVTGFSRKSVLKPTDMLLNAISNPGQPVSSSLFECCQTEFDISDDYGFTDSEDEEFMFPDESQVPENPQPSTSNMSTSSPNSVIIKDLLLKQTILAPVRQEQQLINREVFYLKNDIDLNGIHSYLNQRLNAFYTDTIANKIKPDNAANGIIFSSLSKHINEFLDKELTSYLQEESLPEKYHNYIRQMMGDMMTDLFEEEAAKAGTEAIADLYSSEQFHISSDAGRGVIRRVGGRAVYLAIKEQTKKISTLVKKNQTLSPEYKDLKRTIKCLQAMKASEEEVLLGKYPETSAETSRRNRRNTNLMQITDEVYEYFHVLEKSRDACHTVGECLLHGDEVTKNTYHSLLLNIEIEQKLRDAMPGADQILLEKMNKLLIKKYLPVGNNQYRKTLVTHFEKCKKLAHRPQIAATEESTSKKRKKTTGGAPQKAKDEDEECRSRSCVVRRSKKAAEYDWICCDYCEEWYHVVCTSLDKGLTTDEIEKLTWYCIFCDQDTSNKE